MKYFILAFFGFALALSSCKKEGCTDLNASNFDGKAKKDNGTCTYVVVVAPIDTICDGLQIDNTHWPLYSGVFRRYKTVLGSANFDITEQVLGQVVLNGVTWYEVRITSYLGGSPTQTTEYFRKNLLSGNLFRKSGTSEILQMPGTPVEGQQILTDYFITDLNASKSTLECNYTGCLKATKVDGLGTYNIWFKKGVGKIAYESPLGSDQLSQIYD